MKRRKRLLLLLIPVALPIAAFALSAGSASAPASSNPAWFIGGTELKGSEELGGLAEPSKLNVAGVSTSCEHSLYIATIQNKLGSGTGEVKELPLFGCTANAGCTLEKIEPANLPWALHTVFVGTTPYLLIEGVALKATYSGGSCALAGTHEITGSIGAEIKNEEQKTVFSEASAKATGTALKAEGTAATLEGVYTIEAVGTGHHGEVVEAK